MVTQTRAQEAENPSSRCPYCHDDVEDREAARCQACSTPQHVECFREHGSCVTLGCDNESLSWSGLEVRPLAGGSHPRVRVRQRAQRRGLAFYYWWSLIGVLVGSFGLELSSQILHFRRVEDFFATITKASFLLFIASALFTMAQSYFSLLSARAKPETVEERAHRHDWQTPLGLPNPMASSRPQIVSEDLPVEDWRDEAESEEPAS